MGRKADEEEAKRRCLAGGHSLYERACQLSSFESDDDRPLWRAHYLPEVEAEREEDKAPGFTAFLVVFYVAVLTSPAWLAALIEFFWKG